MDSKRALWILIAVIGLGLAAGCSDDDTTQPPVPVDQFETVRQALDNTLATKGAPIMSAADLYANLNDGNSADDPYILSVRTGAQFAKGHIPGAHNIPWKSVATTANMADLPSKSTVMVVYCYTGHTAAIATTVLRAMGYNAMNLKHGMSAWTTVDSIVGTTPFREEDVQDYATETTAHTFGATTYAFPTLNVTTSQDTNEIIRAAGEAYLSDGSKSATITAQAVFENLNDNNSANDPIILSVRSAEHYALGHVPGAYNIPWTEIAKAENLAKLDPTKQIVVYCYTGHTAGIAATALNMLGYNAVNMKFGMCGWTTDAAVRATTPFSPPTSDYPVEQ